MLGKILDTVIHKAAVNAIISFNPIRSAIPTKLISLRPFPPSEIGSIVINHTMGVIADIFSAVSRLPPSCINPTEKGIAKPAKCANKDQVTNSENFLGLLIFLKLVVKSAHQLRLVFIGFRFLTKNASKIRINKQSEIILK